MKHLITIFTICYSLTSHAQLVNGSFEEFQLNPIGFSEPVGWASNQTQLLARLAQDTFSTVGLYSVRLFPSEAASGWTGCESIIRQTVQYPEGLPETITLTFDYYTSGLDTTMEQTVFHAAILSIEDGQVVANEIFSSDEGTSGWVSETLEASFPDADSIQVVFTSGAVPSPDDGCGLRTVAFIDNVALSTASTSVETPIEPENLIRPNPANDYINIGDAGKGVASLTILDMQGRVVLTTTTAAEIYVPIKGLLIARVVFKDGSVQTSKFVNH